MFEFIKKIYINIVRISLFSILLWICGFVLYFIIGYFQIPSSEKKTFYTESDCCIVTIDTKFKTNNLWSNILDRDGNIDYILKIQLKDNYYFINNNNYMNSFTITFSDDDGFSLFESNFNFNEITHIVNKNNDVIGFYNAFKLFDFLKYNSSNFSFENYNNIKKIYFTHNQSNIRKKLEIPKGWEEVNPDTKIDESKIIWDNKKEK